MRIIELMFWLAAGVTLGGAGVSAKATLERQELVADLSAAHADARFDRHVADQLLSGGRFVRQYDAKAGRSTYTFKPAVRK